MVARAPSEFEGTQVPEQRAGTAPVPALSESVARPEPGLASGRYEAPQWVFLAVAAAAILGLVVAGALAVRTEWARRAGQLPPPSSRRGAGRKG
jgi:hypothetical protein